MQIMTAKITTLRTLYVHVVSNSVMFPQILCYCSICSTLSEVFFAIITFINYVSSYRNLI